MVDAPDLEPGAPDLPCARCGHDARDHAVREVEVGGHTHRDSFCERCNAACDFVPDPRAV